jgi:putative sigma-54 modulation protein
VKDREAELPEEVVRVKYFHLQPMTIREAWEHLQMVGHDFYMFRNAETEEINVIYQRNHGGYGVIQPLLEEPGKMNQFPSMRTVQPSQPPVLRMHA